MATLLASLSPSLSTTWSTATPPPPVHLTQRHLNWSKQSNRKFWIGPNNWMHTLLQRPKQMHAYVLYIVHCKISEKSRTPEIGRHWWCIMSLELQLLINGQPPCRMISLESGHRLLHYKLYKLHIYMNTQKLQYVTASQGRLLRLPIDKLKISDSVDFEQPLLRNSGILSQNQRLFADIS